MADQETGEISIFDCETGEILQRLPICKPTPITDAETGEPTIERDYKKHHFQVPKSLYKENHQSKRSLALHTIGYSFPQHRTNSQPACCIEEKMVSGSQNMSPIVFMLPTLFLFPAWASVLCIVLELCIHMWAHKRNKLHQNNLVVLYKSPLNMITSEFCALCRSDKLMDRIGKLQDERKLKVDSRKLRAYMEKVSSIVT